jgi:N-acetylmuramoyl-L-alanine amidase
MRTSILLPMAAAALTVALLIAPIRAGSVKKFILVLDPGHTPEKPGAMSARGVPEREFNLRVAERIRATLAADPELEVVVTNRPDESVPNAHRIAFANRIHADLYLAIHHDSAQDEFFSTWTYQGKTLRYCDRFEGFSLFVPDPGGAAFRLASDLGRRLVAAGLRPTLHHAMTVSGEGMTLLDPETGVYLHSKPLAILRHTRMPAVLLECGLIVNRAEELKLSDPAYQQRIADAVREAVEDYRGYNHGVP